MKSFNKVPWGIEEQINTKGKENKCVSNNQGKKFQGNISQDTMCFCFVLFFSSCRWQLFFQNNFFSIVQASGFIIISTQVHKSDQAMCIGPKALDQLEYDWTICFLPHSLMQVVKKWQHLEIWLLWMVFFSFTTALARRDKNNGKEVEKCYNSEVEVAIFLFKLPDFSAVFSHPPKCTNRSFCEGFPGPAGNTWPALRH